MEDVHLHLVGSLTAGEYPNLRNDLLAALRSAEVLRVHLWAISDFDPSTIAALLTVKEEAIATNKHVSFVDVYPALEESLQLHLRRSRSLSGET